MMRTIPLANQVMEMTNRFKVSIVAGAATAALAVAMVPAMAFASNTVTSPATSAETNLIYQVNEGYEWSVPSDIDFGSDKGPNATSTVEANGDAGTTQKVKVTKNVIPVGKKLVISADSSNDFTVKSGAASLDYTVEASSRSITAGSNVLTVNAGTNTADQALTFTLTTASGVNAAEQAGRYTGTMTFASSVDNQ